MPNLASLTISLCLALLVSPALGDEPLTPFGKIAWQESTIPIRPGQPGLQPFWNARARQFIYAPAFDYPTVPDAASYRYDLTSLADSSSHTFQSDVPYAPLSEVWASVPIGQFNLTVTALSPAGRELALAGQGRYYRAAPFNGPYHEPALPYDQSAALALDRLMQKDYVAWWLDHHAPDPNYINYRYPAKIYSALIVGAVTHARLHPDTPQAKRSTELAAIVADSLIDISFKPGSPWEFFPPTYYGPHSENAKKDHMKPINCFSIMGADAGHAYLDLYDLVHDEKYLLAAKRIAETYRKTQLPNGSWYQFVNHETGEPTAQNIVIPTAMINYFDRLKRDYHVPGLEDAANRALHWIMQNPVKTFDWQGQFEDVYARPPYQNLSREQACDLAIYLFKNNTDLPLAQELVRFAEDQFVIWEQPPPINPNHSNPGHRSENWITPSVQEQTVFWMPVGRAAGIMMETFWQAWQATQNDLYLAKAISIANAFTLVQREHHGDFPTFFTPHPMNRWLNSTVYPAKLLMKLHRNLQKLEGKAPLQRFLKQTPRILLDTKSQRGYA